MALLEYSLTKNGSYLPLPTPSPENYYTTRTHEERSYLDSNGYLHRDIVRKNRNKVYCGWDALNGEEIALLDSLYSLDYFYLRFTDNQNKRIICKVYAGPLDSRAILMDKQSLAIKLRTSVTMNFIEY